MVTAAERPDLWEQVRDRRLFDGLWPEYNGHGNHAGRYFGSLIPKHSDLQLLFIDRRSSIPVARGRTIPFHWDGTLEDLPRGIDAVGLRAVEDQAPPTALSALAAEVDPAYQSSGLSGLLLEAMAAVARARGLAPLVAPVRPSWKDRYPVTPIGHYARWRRDDGLLFDPWLRTHERLGGRVLRCEPRSLEITAPTVAWEQWTGMRFPEPGQYTFPRGLALLETTTDSGSYFEPNVWMIHVA